MAEAHRLAIATAAHRWLGQTSWREGSVNHNATGPSPLSAVDVDAGRCCRVPGWRYIVRCGSTGPRAWVFLLLRVCVRGGVGDVRRVGDGHKRGEAPVSLRRADCARVVWSRRVGFWGVSAHCSHQSAVSAQLDAPSSIVSRVNQQLRFTHLVLHSEAASVPSSITIACYYETRATGATQVHNFN